MSIASLISDSCSFFLALPFVFQSLQSIRSCIRYRTAREILMKETRIAAVWNVFRIPPSRNQQENSYLEKSRYFYCIWLTVNTNNFAWVDDKPSSEHTYLFTHVAVFCMHDTNQARAELAWICYENSIHPQIWKKKKWHSLL